MIPTAKFICPVCKEEIHVDWFDIKMDLFQGAAYYSFECPKCKIKLGVTPDEFEHYRVDG